MVLTALLLMAQGYSGPAPARAGVPYLLHAGNLISTEVTEAKESKTKDGSTFTIAGDRSPVKTPLASPIFIMRAGTLNPAALQVFLLETREGHREVTFSPKGNPQAYTLTVKQMQGDEYRLEVNESLPAGEYSITPPGSNQVFCFAVY